MSNKTVTLDEETWRTVIDALYIERQRLLNTSYHYGDLAAGKEKIIRLLKTADEAIWAAVAPKEV